MLFRRPRRIGGGIAGVQASEAERASRACLRARSPVPRSCPWRLDARRRAADLGCASANQLRAGPSWPGWSAIAARRSGRCSRRHGVSRRRRTPRQRSFRRYEWAQPGALLHMDTKRLQRFAPARALGDRRSRARSRATAARGYVYAHCVVDDHSRLAYVELHSADTGQRGRGHPAPRRSLDARAGRRPDRGGDDRQRVRLPPQPPVLRASWTSSAPATSAPRPTRRAGTARRNDSSRRSTTNGPTAASGPTAPDATAACHRSCASTTAADHTPHSATGHPSAAFTKTVGRTARPAAAGR